MFFAQLDEGFEETLHIFDEPRTVSNQLEVQSMYNWFVSDGFGFFDCPFERVSAIENVLLHLLSHPAACMQALCKAIQNPKFPQDVGNITPFASQI
jgi:hypothetical protein